MRKFAFIWLIASVVGLEIFGITLCFVEGMTETFAFLAINAVAAGFFYTYPEDL